jgi:hypothetical protein
MRLSGDTSDTIIGSTPNMDDGLIRHTNNNISDSELSAHADTQVIRTICLNNHNMVFPDLNQQFSTNPLDRKAGFSLKICFVNDTPIDLHENRRPGVGSKPDSEITRDRRCRKDQKENSIGKGKTPKHGQRYRKALQLQKTGGRFSGFSSP